MQCSATLPMAPTTTSTSIPYDVWLHVAQFIPQYQLRDLYAVNSHLLDIAMNERYRSVELNLLNKSSMRKLIRLRSVIPRLTSIRF